MNNQQGTTEKHPYKIDTFNISKKSIADAKMLLIPTISYLATIIDAEKAGVEEETIQRLKERLKESLNFSLEYRSLLCP